jgi:hypothetical protein
MSDAVTRQEFIKDIIKGIQTIEGNPNNMCILMMDANESIDDKSGSIWKLLSETKLVDTFLQVAGYLGQLATYSRGKKRIDYIFTSLALVPYASRVGCLELDDSNLRDHRGMFLDISESIVDTKVTLTQPTQSHIGCKSKSAIIYCYKTYIHKEFLIHHIYKRAKAIENGRNNTRTNQTNQHIRQTNNRDHAISRKITIYQTTRIRMVGHNSSSITAMQVLGSNC